MRQTLYGADLGGPTGKFNASTVVPCALPVAGYILPSPFATNVRLDARCLNASPSCSWDECFAPALNGCSPGAAVLSAAPVALVVHALGALLALASAVRRPRGARASEPLLHGGEDGHGGAAVFAYHAAGVYMPPVQSEPVG